MKLNLITIEDLSSFKQELLEEINKMLQGNHTHQQWLRSQDVQELLRISPGTLHNLREKRVLPHSKISGIIFYDYEDIIEMLRKNKLK
ncbi:MAG: helix-turn-helix domain-containing protein [Marinoscillum sp.]